MPTSQRSVLITPSAVSIVTSEMLSVKSRMEAVLDKQKYDREWRKNTQHETLLAYLKGVPLQSIKRYLIRKFS